MGGLAGHMSHLYDNPRLTFSEIKSILQDAAEGNLEGTEKTDGQNLYISFSVPKQELEFADGGAKAARNKTNIKAGGMNARQLADKFSFNKALKASFSQALRNFGDVVKSFPRDKQIEIFGPDTNIYYNAEIINPDTANVINYDSKLVSIHRGGGAEFDKETGAPVQVEITDPETGEVITGPKDVSRHAQMLSDVLDDVQQDLSNNKFKIEMDAIFNLKALEDKTALQNALNTIESQLSSEGISDSQMVIEYIMARILSILQEEGLSLDEETEKLILKRILLSNPSYRSAYGYDKMPKELDPRTILKNASAKDKNRVIYLLKNSKEILAKAIEPIEGAIHDFSVEMLRGLESLFILDNKKETERLKGEVSKAIAAIEASGHEGALEILQKQMNKLKSVENVSTAAEGFVFDHDGWSYKFTGNFAPINQILGLFKYGRAGIPPLEKINEEVKADDKYVVLIPGGFKPPHKGHYALLENYAKMPSVEAVVVFTGHKPREGVTREMSEQLFELYGGLSDKVMFIEDSKPMGAAFEKLGEQDFVNQFSQDAVFTLGCGDKGKDAARAIMFEEWWNKNEDKNLLNVRVGNIGACPAQISDTGSPLSASMMRKAAREGDDTTLEAHIPQGVDVGSVKRILPSSLAEMIFDIIEEVTSEKQRKWACAQIDDPDELTRKQAKEFCSADLEEYRTINYSMGEPPKKSPKKKKTYNEPGVHSDYRPDKKEAPSREEREDEFDPLEELSAMSAGAVSGPGSKNKDEEEETLIREYIRGIKIKTKIRTKAN